MRRTQTVATYGDAVLCLAPDGVQVLRISNPCCLSKFTPASNARKGWTKTTDSLQRNAGRRIHRNFTCGDDEASSVVEQEKAAQDWRPYHVSLRANARTESQSRTGLGSEDQRSDDGERPDTGGWYLARATGRAKTALVSPREEPAGQWLLLRRGKHVTGESEAEQKKTPKLSIDTPPPSPSRRGSNDFFCLGCHSMGEDEAFATRNGITDHRRGARCKLRRTKHDLPIIKPRCPFDSR